MLDKISVFLVLVAMLFFVYPLYAQNAPKNNTLKIAELEKENTELKLQLENVQKENTELKIKLHSVDYEHLNLKLKGDIIKWLTWIVITIIAVLSGLVVYLIKKEVIDRVKTEIAGEKAKFDEAVQNIEKTKQEIEATKEQNAKLRDEMKEIQYKQTYLILTSDDFNENQSKYLNPEVVMRIMEEESESNLRYIIHNGIDALGVIEYQDKSIIDKAVQFIPQKYLNLKQDTTTAWWAMKALCRIGTQEAIDELIKFKEIFESKGVVKFLEGYKSALSEAKKPEAIPILKEAILKYNAGNLITTIRLIGGGRAKTALKEISEETKDKDIKDSCSNSLKSM